jgi:hypothetical protein
MEEDFATSFIRAYQIGRQLRQQQEQIQGLADQREQVRKMQDYEMKRQKIADQLDMQKFIQQQHIQAAQALQDQPSETPFPAQQIPGISVPEADVETPGYQVQPQTMNELLQQHLRQKQLENAIAAQGAGMTKAAEAPYAIHPIPVGGSLSIGAGTPQAQTIAGQPKPQVPGVDVPYSPEVQKQRIEARKAGAAPQASLSPEGLDIAAEMFAKTGQMPAMGMGAGPVRTAIINRAAQLHPQIDLATNKAGYSANQASLTQLQKNRDAVVSFETTALKNLDIFLNSAKGVVDSGSPIVNTPLRAINEKGLGGQELAAYQAARRVAINEIAKVTSNPNMTGQLSDAARREVEQFIPENATLGQAYAVAAILKQDMANRHQSLDDQIGAIKQRIGGQSAPARREETPSETKRPTHKWVNGKLVEVQ